MTDLRILPLRRAAFALVAFLSLLGTTAAAGSVSEYRMTLENLTEGQPLSPPIAATHGGTIMAFEVGSPVSPEAELLAENGDQHPLYWQFFGHDAVTDVVDLESPLVPRGTAVGGFADRAVFELSARGGDRLSLASMLVCTNDGITGVDRIKLTRGARTYRLLGLDAGSEENTELSADIPDACSALGPVPLPGDPDGNENDAVDTVPHRPVELHPGVMLVGDLGVEHAWSGPVARLTVVRLADARTRRYSAVLNGFAEPFPVATDATGSVRLQLRGKRQLFVRLRAGHIRGVTGAHIHLGEPGIDGPVVATLLAGERAARGPRTPGVRPSDQLRLSVELTEEDLVGGPFEGDFEGFLTTLGQGGLYVNVHTATYPAGEVRGQIGADR